MKQAGFLFLLALSLVVLPAGCGDDDTVGKDAGVDAIVRPDVYVGPCQDDHVPVFQGSNQVVINELQIAATDQGFDLDYDGEPDNLLGLLGSIANSRLDSSMQAGEIIIPMEFFGLDDPQNDECLNFSFYVGIFPPDQDDDGERTDGAVGSEEKDCNDWDPSIFPGATEDGSDYVDNDCDGLADETGDSTPSTNTEDRDGDGYSLADGDCDDRLPSDWPDAPDWWDPTLINPGQEELCGDGFDNNCSGTADEGCNPLTPDDGVDETIPIDASALDENGQEGLIVFRSARIEAGTLLAGPSRFEFSTPIEGRDLVLRLTSTMLTAEVTEDSNGLTLTDGMLGGVLSGRTLDQIPNIAPEYLGGDENSTMLDVIVGSFGTIAALPTVGVCVPKGGGRDLPVPIISCSRSDDCGDTSLYRCNQDVRAPDIDVDGDGIELFLNLNLDNDTSIDRVDACVDGDGVTVVFDDVDTDGTVITHCTQALDDDGQPRFVDGYSIALTFAATPAKLRGTYSSH